MSTAVKSSQTMSWLPGITPEERLIVICARLCLDQSQRDELTALLAGQLRWDQVLYKSQWHKLTALLYRHLNREDSRGRVPVEVMDQLKQTYLSNVARNLYFQDELRRALDALKAQNIPVIVLKGAALAESVYGDIGLRPMVDLDLLVRQEDADSAWSIIEGVGYRPSVDERVQKEMRASGRQLAALVGLRKPVVIEIHAHIVEVDSPLRFDIGGFWDRALVTNLGGRQTLTLGPEDLLTHLAINFFKDRRFYSYSALGQLCDIAEVTRSYAGQINWSALTGQITHDNLRSPVFLGIYLAQHLLGAGVPDQILRQLEPAEFRPKDVERMVRQRVLGDKWVAKALVAPNSSYSWRTFPLAMLKRLFPAKRYLADRYNVPVQSKQVYYLYLRRLAQAFTMGARFVAKPGETRDDFAVDRWLHSLYQANHNAKHRESS